MGVTILGVFVYMMMYIFVCMYVRPPSPSSLPHTPRTLTRLSHIYIYMSTPNKQKKKIFAREDIRKLYRKFEDELH